MIKSMTGYGRAASVYGGFDISVELKSVNNRYLEVAVKTPRAYSFLEDKVKALVRDKLNRGKVDVFISVTENGEVGADVAPDLPLARGYYKALCALSDELGLENDVTLSDMARFSDIFKLGARETDEEALTQGVLAAASDAIKSFVAMRETEGEKLKADILARADTVLACVSFIEERSPETARAYRERLEQSVRDLLGDASVDETRLLTETAVFADRIAVDEETVRLRSHIGQMTALVSGDGPAGRKLDFIVQEMNREANTIGSKAQDIEITRRVVEIKAEIEKIREQIQNIE